ncbi:MAG: hypothetical protein O7A06_03655, partial [Acidobacteria bacterium]|nr:hypothetical protein [Acidobacteriota bacterium]
MTSTEAVLALKNGASNRPQRAGIPNRESLSRAEPGSEEAEGSGVRSQKQGNNGAVLRLKLAGSNPAPQVTGIEELPGKSNYFIGNDPEMWRTNVPHYAKVRYQDVYPGVDLIYYGNQRQLEYDFVVAPGADPEAIQLELQGADHLEIDA